ncbi:MAG: hypothetical protein HWD61_06160 [Parachlamydiaceae bacterium]|nr:MAG: hypothetical protein HWD61_06160 [Parachlamydiaceae bacterium]
MSYTAWTFLVICLFAIVHLFAANTQKLGFIVHGRFLSAGGGIAIAYIFIDLLPKLSKSDLIVTQALSGVFPYFERHVYIMALIGFLLFFIVDRAQTSIPYQGAFWLSLGSYALFNFLIGYAVSDPHNPEVQPLLLFAFAISLHYFTNDYSLNEAHGDDYRRFGKWILILSIFAGWTVGLWMTLSATAIALVSAFIGGGVIMNVTRHELPRDNPNSVSAFICGALFYTAILLMIGS